MLYVKKSVASGCLFMGKGIVDHPEMGVIVECREVMFDEMDIRGDWKNHEELHFMYRTDTGYSFDANDIYGPQARFQIEEYAPNWRKHRKDAWGLY